MLRLFKSLAQPQSTPLQVLSKIPKIPLVSPHHLINNVPHHKTLSYQLSASFFGLFSSKSPKNSYIQDLGLIQNHSNQELASFQQILKKYLSSQDFTNFTQEESTVLLKAFDQLGKVCFGPPIRESDALKYYEEAMKFVKAKGMTDSKEVAALHNGLAYTLYLHQRLSEALGHFEKAQEMLEKVGLDGESVYPYIQNIYFQGAISLTQGNLQKAEEYLQIALETSEAIPQRDLVEPFLVDIYENLAYVYLKKNNLEQAREYAKKALEIIPRIFGEDHLRSVALSRNLAIRLFSQEKFDDALLYAKKLNNSLKRNSQADKNEDLQSLVLIAEIYTKKNDFSNASAHFKQALDILEKSSKSFQGAADNIYFLAAKSHFAEGKFQEAKELFNKVISIGRNKFGETGIQIANGLNAWGQILETNENTKKDAYETYRKSLEIYKKFGDQHIVDVIHNTTRLAELARQLGNYGESVDYARKALKLCSESGQNLHWLEEINNLLGTSLFVGGNEAEGLKHFEEAARLCEESSDKSGNLQSHYHILADAHFRAKNMERAEKKAKKALEVCASKFGNADPNTQACLSLLLRILDAQKKTDDAVKLRQVFGVE